MSQIDKLSILRIISPTHPHQLAKHVQHLQGICLTPPSFQLKKLAPEMMECEQHPRHPWQLLAARMHCCHVVPFLQLFGPLTALNEDERARVFVCKLQRDIMILLLQRIRVKRRNVLFSIYISTCIYEKTLRVVHTSVLIDVAFITS